MSKLRISYDFSPPQQPIIQHCAYSLPLTVCTIQPMEEILAIIFLSCSCRDAESSRHFIPRNEAPYRL